MSVHLLECAAHVKIDGRFTATHKLALMCFADSGSSDTRIARPGLDALLVWTCAKRSWALEVVNDLVELQLLARHQRAYRGRRAEFVVFPNGCCLQHGIVPADVREIEPDVVAELVKSGSDKGSATPDPLIRPAVDLMGPISPDALGYPQRPLPADPIEADGSAGDGRMGPVEPQERVRSARSNLEPSKNVPPTPSPSSTTDRQPLQPRDGRPPSENRFNLAAKTGDGCGRCYDGDILDVRGDPVMRCPYCQPATQGATA